MGADGVPRLARRLAALQVSIFLLQEVLERLDAGAPLGERPDAAGCCWSAC